MKKYGIYFASASGRTRNVAMRLEKELLPAQVSLHDLRSSSIDDIQKQNVLVFGTPTYGSGEMHHLWEKWCALLKQERIDLREKRIAIFALGDYKHHPRTFASGLTRLYELVASLGITPIGQLPSSNTSSFEAHSHLLRNEYLPGLVLDEVSERAKTNERIANWARQIQLESGEILP